MKPFGNRIKQYSLEFKIAVVEEYLSSDITQVELGEKYGIAVQPKREGQSASCSSVNYWCNLYKRGLLKVGNAIAVSHTPKEVVVLPKTLIVNDVKYKQYVMPTDTIVIEDITYVKA